MKASDIQEIDFDFGFTAVDEEVEATSGEVQTLRDKLLALRRAIEPLLKNLEANPEKAYIHWPDRTSKVKAFRTKLDSIQKL